MSRYPDEALITWEQARAAAPRLKQYRTERKWSRGQLSVASGVGASTIAHAESAQVRLTKVNADLLAKALGMSFGSLAGTGLEAAR
jgi:transcriptional regulator with XRE-family HTH domain